MPAAPTLSAAQSSILEADATTNALETVRTLSTERVRNEINRQQASIKDRYPVGEPYTWGNREIQSVALLDLLAQNGTVTLAEAQQVAPLIAKLKVTVPAIIEEAQAVVANAESWTDLMAAHDQTEQAFKAALDASTEVADVIASRDAALATLAQVALLV